MLESWCSYYYYPAYYRIEWYWNWKIACINLAERVVQKCWTAITHKYATAVERICKPTKMCQNRCFKVIFCVCLDTFSIIRENLGPRNKLIIFFYISLERPRVLKNAAKMGIGLDIYGYLPLESNISN